MKKKFSSVASNPKFVWKLVNDLTGRTFKNKDSVDSININNHILILNIEENTKEVSNQLNNFVVNVGKKLAENSNDVPKIDLELTNNRTCLYSFDEMFHKEIDAPEVCLIINNFKDDSDSGYERITVKILKNLYPI